MNEVLRNNIKFMYSFGFYVASISAVEKLTKSPNPPNDWKTELGEVITNFTIYLLLSLPHGLNS